MTVFTIIATLLIVVALLFILPTLLRKPVATNTPARDEINLSVLRDQWQELDADLAAGTLDTLNYEKSRQELEQRVVEDIPTHAAPSVSPNTHSRWTAVGLGLAVPMLAIALYVWLGTPAGLDPAQVAAPTNQAHELTQEQIMAMVARLAQRMQTQPNDVEGWTMLARSYNALGQFQEAAQAYAHLAELTPNDAALLADYADTLAMASNKSLQGEPEAIIAHALAVDPKNIKALALSGSAAFERRDYQTAVTQWSKILALVPPDSDFAKSTQGSIDEAKALAGEPITAPVVAASSATQSISGTVELDPALRSQVADTDTVFIFARTVQGPRFPLAVLRKQVKDLPTHFLLDDSMGMMPNVKLSDFPSVVVGARISKTGSATPSAGDFEGLVEPVALGAKDLKIRIQAQR